jgi:ABC-2 type transport system ATP-binding protein
VATAIAFRSVSKRFRSGSLSLADATFVVEEGARACLLGPSGSGKSTAIRILQGALVPTGGSVHVFGIPVDEPDFRQIRQRMGLVPQGPGMYPDLTAGEYMALAARLSGVRPDRAVEALGLNEYLHTRLTLLSNSFQRRLALAAALVADPDILVMDEPTGGLDPAAGHDLHRYLREAMHGRTCLLATHNEAEAEQLCDEVVSMRSGRVVAQGTWADLRQRSRPRLRLIARQSVDMTLMQLREFGFHVEPDEDSVLVEVDDVAADAPELLKRLLDAGIEVYQCVPVRPSVEGVFLEAPR